MSTPPTSSPSSSSSPHPITTSPPLATALPSQSNCAPSSSALIETIVRRKDEWLSLCVEEKVRILDVMMQRLKTRQDDFVEASAAKRLYAGGGGKGGRWVEEMSCRAQVWLHTGVMLGMWLSALRDYYDTISRTGSPPVCDRVVDNIDGTKRVQVGPRGALLNVLLSFGSAELYVDGSAEPQLADKAGLSLVLGAGNYDCPIDILTAMFIRNHVCLYKWSPMSHDIADVVQDIFSVLVDKGFLGFVSHGDDISQLVHHTAVDLLIMTGSARTANTLLFGQAEPPPEGTAVRIRPPICFELGNCTPWLIVPGIWSVFEMHRHARQLSMGILYNGGHVCTHVQLIVTSKDWPQRQQFLSILRAYLQEAPVVGCFYPNYKERMSLLKDQLLAEGQTQDEMVVETTAPSSGGSEPLHEIIFATDLPHDTVLTRQEAFCPVVGEVALDTPSDASAFLSDAVEFVNSKCHGTLCITISVKTKSQQDEYALEKALCELQYASIGVNCYGLLCIGFANLVWGGYPGATVYDLKSGIGFLGNCYGFEKPLKAVIRQPFINMTHFCLTQTSASSVKRMDKTWRRLSAAFCESRQSQSLLSLLWDLTKISSGLLFNI
eukprot:GHVQ01033518.1.p1 GENE.GHVQ01033518.1~~GHVQ01033518.1.p1  ORF type:complete len:619 (-),score=117.26 GHVQ01033518.1:353-2170(-)